MLRFRKILFTALALVAVGTLGAAAESAFSESAYAIPCRHDKCVSATSCGFNWDTDCEIHYLGCTTYLCERAHRSRPPYNTVIHEYDRVGTHHSSFGVVYGSPNTW